MHSKYFKDALGIEWEKQVEKVAYPTHFRILAEVRARMLFVYVHAYEYVGAQCGEGHRPGPVLVEYPHFQFPAAVEPRF